MVKTTNKKFYTILVLALIVVHMKIYIKSTSWYFDLPSFQHCWEKAVFSYEWKIFRCEGVNRSVLQDDSASYEASFIFPPKITYQMV